MIYEAPLYITLDENEKKKVGGGLRTSGRSWGMGGPAGGGRPAGEYGSIKLRMLYLS